MLIRTTRPTTLRGRPVAAGLPFDLPEEEAQALVDAGDAEPWAPPAAADRDAHIAARMGQAAPPAAARAAPAEIEE